jgi:hypothetical protein
MTRLKTSSRYRKSVTRRCLFVTFAGLALIVVCTATAADDAEILSRRVPNQSYHVSDTFALLRREKAWWGIPLWACDPATLTITKVLGGSAPAPYAIVIRPQANNPISEIYTHRRLRTIHLLAASKEDAEKMRRALVAEIETMQQFIEKRQGNRPGYLKEPRDLRIGSD